KLDGGSGKDYSLEIGSNTFIPGFEDELVGMSIGDTKKINLKFPEDYVENLKGKDVTFTVTIKGIKERVVPALGKDFYEDLAIDGVDSKESLEEYIKSELSEKKNDEVENKYVDELLHKATDNMEVEINNEIIDEEVHHMIHQYEDELKYQGASLQQYLAMTKTKMEDLENMMKPQAIARIKTRFLLEEIVDKENIKASAAEIKEEVKNNAAKYGMKDEEFLDAMGGNDAIAYDIKMKKAVEIIKEA
ncbi:MAG TPA: trigger factor, partial [Bacilli bacterium]|nr:trigger factor [Bacilli bacterium]